MLNIFYRTNDFNMCRCNIQWYTAPLYAQKLLFIALQRSMKNSNLLIGSLVVASLESFATVMLHFVNKFDGLCKKLF